MTSTIAADFRHALRRWRQRPGFALTVIVTLALGIGATTAIFSVVDAVLLRPLPWPDANRLVVIHAVEPERLLRPALAVNWNRATLGWQEWDALRATGAFEHVAAWWPSRFLYTGDAGPELLEGLYASSNLLQTLGVRPHLGRMFTTDEDRTDTDFVVISYELWQRRFGARQDILGRTIDLGLGSSDPGRPRTIVGVLPPRLRFQGQAPECVLPLGLMAYNLSYATNRPLRVLARLASGVSTEAAHGAAAPIIRGTEVSARRTARVASLPDDELGQAARPLWLLFGGAALLLLVSCANVAGLLLGEARARRHEIAVRTSLGGSFGRILRHLAVEQLLLSTAAAAAGVVLAIWLTPVVVAIAPERLPRLDAVEIDLRLAALALGLGILTATICTLAPAISLARTPAALVLAEGSRDAAARRQIGQRLVVATEIAVALVLVVGASLFGETMTRLTARPLGFESTRLVVVSLSAAARPYTQEEWQRILARRNDPDAPGAVQPRMSREEMLRRLRERDLARTNGILDRLSALPGVVSAAGVTGAPFAATPRDVPVRRHSQPAGQEIVASMHGVTEQYFQAIGLPIVRGRGFDKSDGLGARRVVVSRELERRVFDGQAVGQQIVLGSSAPSTGSPYEVVGVAENAKQREFADEDRAAVYVLDRAGSGIGNATVGQYVIRTSVDPTSLLPRIRETLRTSDPPLVITASQTMEELVAGSVAEPRFRATLAAVFGGAALVLAAVGLYGLAARRVEERRREIGVRMALGARPRDVRRLVLRDTLRTLGLGLGVGWPAAYLASQVTQAFLFGVSPTAPHIFLIASCVLAGVAILATIVPARRASSLDPMLVLKE